MGTMRRLGSRAPAGHSMEADLTAFFTFHTSIASPIPLEKRIIHEVSLSMRYRKMTVWKKRLSSIELSERPRMLLLFFQKAMSFLKASTSKTVCSTLTKAVTPSSHGEVSASIRLISSIEASPCIWLCISRLCCICAVSCQRINVVQEKSSRSGSSVTVSLIEVSASFGRQNSLMKTGGKYAPVSESMTSTCLSCGGIDWRVKTAKSATSCTLRDPFQCGASSVGFALSSSAAAASTLSLNSPESRFLVALTTTRGT
mmetsp:Transcript_69332/g.167679  ORF Transcript_69332/g.167679 Transcript_69332/m.167679 type:complete len:257 (+) Transcript_69332:58-828(+)